MSEGDQGGELGCDSLRRSSRAGAEVTDSICGVPCHRIAQSSESEVSESRSVNRCVGVSGWREWMCVGRNYVHVSSLLRSSIAASVALLLPVPVNCVGNRVGREWVRSGGYFPKGSDCPSYGFNCPPPQPAADAPGRQSVT